jgi:hypothetical protein
MRIILGVLLALPLLGQEHPYSNAWTYYTWAVTESLQFTATTVAGTGGTDTHTMTTVAVYIQSPMGREAWAFEYPSATTGQATAYLSLCAALCEDGDFFVSTRNTEEQCGQTYVLLIPAVSQGTGTVSAWVQWISAAANPTNISRTNSSTTVTGTLRKSQACSGVSAVSLALIPNPSQIAVVKDPNADKQPTFGGQGTAQVSWTVSTTSGNSVGGTVTASFGIESTSCTVQGGSVKNVDFTVAN